MEIKEKNNVHLITILRYLQYHLLRCLAHMVEQNFVQICVAGSSPVISYKNKYLKSSVRLSVRTSGFHPGKGVSITPPMTGPTYRDTVVKEWSGGFGI